MNILIHDVDKVNIKNIDMGSPYNHCVTIEIIHDNRISTIQLYSKEQIMV